MNVQTENSDITVVTAKRNGHQPSAPASRKPIHLHELSLADRFLKPLFGLALFVGWLLLFVMGMSLSAKQYTDCLTKPDSSVNWYFLLIYGLLFTPTNGAILASLAGVLGGIASNLAAANKFSHAQPDLTDTESDDFQSYLYMTENPLVSMLRGFTTYLIFIAGSYLTTFTTSGDVNNPGQVLGLTASAYFKFAVTVSLLAYLAGYDPSRMKSLINSFSLTKKDADQTIIQGKHIVKNKTGLDTRPPRNGAVERH